MSKIYQFKIILLDYQPVIWRRIQVPEDFTFQQFHYAIQCSMGWKFSHMHQFHIKNPNTDAEDIISVKNEFFPENVLETETKLVDYFNSPGQRAMYEYDFGDSWEHGILLEEVLDEVPGKNYPVCTAGENACPPEDCGGTPGYENLLKILADSNHEEHDEMKEWLENAEYTDFDPKVFNPDDVNFFSE